MAICWERFFCHLFSVLILNAVLVVLVPFDVWGGMWNWLYWLLIIAFLSIFHSQPKLRAVAGFWKVVRPWDAESVPRVPKARERSFPISYCGGGGSGDLVRENFGFRKAVDAFLLHLECKNRFIHSVSFVGMLEEIFLIIVTFEHMTTQTHWTQLFRHLTEWWWHLEELCF